jgi:hypothetical protein
VAESGHEKIEKKVAFVKKLGDDACIVGYYK